MWEKSDDWSYQCLNVNEAVRNSSVTWIGGQIRDNSDVDIQDIILQTNVVGKYYIDEVTISRDPVSIDRQSPSLPNDNVMVKSVEVAAGNASDSYEVSIVPWTCNGPEDDLELFGILDADISGLDTSSMTPLEAHQAKAEFLRTADSVVFTSAAWGAGTVTVERIQRGTRAVTGSFTITYRNQVQHIFKPN